MNTLAARLRAAGLLPAVLALVALQALIWSLGFGLTYKSPENDSVEQLVWAFSLEGGYWKHPPLPSWIMHGLLALFGPSLQLPFAAAQACIAVAMLLTWRLGASIMGATASLVALLLTSLVTYHNFGADAYNHNIVLLPFQAALTLAFYRATRSGSDWHWALAGICAGLAMLVKYVAVFPMMALGVYFLLDRSLHTRRNFAGIAVAAALFALVFTPHVLWLLSNDFLPLTYAHSVSLRLTGFAHNVSVFGEFVGTQLLRVAPLFVAAWLVFGWRGAASADKAPVRSAPSDRLFLWVAGLGPILLTLAYGIATQTVILNRWGTNGFLLAGWLVVDAVGRSVGAREVRRALWIVLPAHLALCAAFTLAKTQGAQALEIRSGANFPGQAVARLAHTVWSEHSGDPLRIVVGSVWLGGNIAAHSTEPPAVLIDGDFVKAPWVRPEDIAACGALVLVDDTVPFGADGDPSLGESEFMARAQFTGEWRLPWAAGRRLKHQDSGSGRIVWGVIPRTGEAPCRL